MRTVRIPYYLPGKEQRCSECGGTAWHVGRVTATCARCEAAMLLPDTHGGFVSTARFVSSIRKAA